MAAESKGADTEAIINDPRFKTLKTLLLYCPQTVRGDRDLDEVARHITQKSLDFFSSNEADLTQLVIGLIVNGQNRETSSRIDDVELGILKNAFYALLKHMSDANSTCMRFLRRQNNFLSAAIMQDVLSKPTVGESWIAALEAFASLPQQTASLFSRLCTSLEFCLANESLSLDHTSETHLKSPLDRTSSSPVDIERFSGPANRLSSHGMDHKSTFIAHVRKCHMAYQKIPGYYANYFPIVQSSGFGKTRTLMDCREEFVTVYICLRKASAVGWPGRTPEIADWVTNSGTFKGTPDLWTKLLWALPRVLDGVNQQQDELFPMTEDWSEVMDWSKRLWMSEDQEFQKCFWRRVMEVAKSCPQEVTGYFSPTGRLKHWLKDRNKTILFAVDEARSMLACTFDAPDIQVGSSPKPSNSFLQFRRGLTKSMTCNHLIAVVADTSSTVSNFSPTSEADPSARGRSVGTRLHPPFCLMPMQLDVSSLPRDLYAIDPRQYDIELQFSLPRTAATQASETLQGKEGEGQEDAMLEGGFESAEEYDATEAGFQTAPQKQEAEKEEERLTSSIVWGALDLVLLSRPMFACEGLRLLSQQAVETLDVLMSSLSETVKIALSKLTLQEYFSPPVSPLACFALMSSRVYMGSVLGLARDELVRAYMANLKLIAEDRSEIYIEYRSEPCLAAAAKHYMASNFTGLLQQCCQSLIHGNMVMFNGGLGEIGELIMQLLLLRAADVAVSSAPPGEYMKYRYYVDSVSSAQGAQSDKEDYQFRPRKGLIDVGWHPVPFVWMLRQLYSQAEFDKIVAGLQYERLHNRPLGDLLSGYVFLTHFIRSMNYSPDLAKLAAFWERGAGVLCRSGEVGVDSIIPLMLPAERGLAINPRDGRSYRMSGCLVQVNHGKSALLSPESLLEKAKDHSLVTEMHAKGVPFVFLCLNVKASAHGDWKSSRSYTAAIGVQAPSSVLGVRHSRTTSSEVSKAEPPAKKAKSSSSSRAAILSRQPAAERASAGADSEARTTEESPPASNSGVSLKFYVRPWKLRRTHERAVAQLKTQEGEPLPATVLVLGKFGLNEKAAQVDSSSPSCPPQTKREDQDTPCLNAEECALLRGLQGHGGALEEFAIAEQMVARTGVGADQMYPFVESCSTLQVSGLFGQR
eukprot:gene28433-34325_t